MAIPRYSVRGILDRAFESSGLDRQIIQNQERVDSSDDFLSLTTFLRPINDSQFNVIDYRNAGDQIAVRRYLLVEGRTLSPRAGFYVVSSLRDFQGWRRQCIMFSDSFVYESPFGIRPAVCDYTTAAQTFFPSRATLRTALNARTRPEHQSSQIFGVPNMTRLELEAELNQVYTVEHHDRTVELSFAYGLYSRAVKFNKYTISVIILKTFLRGKDIIRKRILWAMHEFSCIFCGLVGAPLLFHDVRIDPRRFFLASTTPNCRNGNLQAYFDFNTNYFLKDRVTWVSHHLLVLSEEITSNLIPWDSQAGFISIVTMLMRLFKANFGNRVTSNAIARAYLIMFKGFLRVRFGDSSAENAFIRGLYMLEGKYFDLPDDRAEMFRDYELFTQWLASPLPSRLPCYLLIELLFKDDVFATNADMDGLSVFVPLSAMF